MTDRPEYVEHQLIKAIAEDPRLGELEVDVTVEDSLIRLTGRVASERHRRDLVALVRDRFPGYELVDQTEPVEMPPPPTGPPQEEPG